MLNTIFATKLGMTQAWSTEGKRLAVTKCQISGNFVVGEQNVKAQEITHKSKLMKDCRVVEIGYGEKKLKNVNKPLRTRMEKSGFSKGVMAVKGLRRFDETAETAAELVIGQTIKAEQVLSVGDVVSVQGTTKGKGFAGVVKRFGFAGGPATHGQSDRERAVGSIGNRTTPGRVFKNKRMHGHMGTDTKTVSGLVVLHIDPTSQEVWLSGPIPGSVSGLIQIQKTGSQKTVELDFSMLNIKPAVAPSVEVKEEAEATA